MSLTRDELFAAACNRRDVYLDYNLKPVKIDVAVKSGVFMVIADDAISYATNPLERFHWTAQRRTLTVERAKQLLNTETKVEAEESGSPVVGTITGIWTMKDGRIKLCVRSRFYEAWYHLDKVVEV